jgi:predicted RNase H-like HicB family nuclease
MKESQHYLKIVEWSEEDHCFIGQCPGIVGPCCHGNDEAQVYAELCQIVDEWITIFKQEEKPLPPTTAGKNIVDQILSWVHSENAPLYVAS